MTFNNSRNEKLKRFFPVPNEVFQMDLCNSEIVIYSYLLYCEDRDTFKCHPSYTTIGDSVGLSKNTVMKYVAMLEDKGLIKTEHSEIEMKNGEKRNGNLIYTILPINDAYERFYERQMQQLEQENARARAKKRLDAFERKHPRKAVDPA